MDTQQFSSGQIGAVEVKNDGLAILFLLMGAPHIYGALRSRRRRANLAPKFTVRRCLKIMFAAAALAGVTEGLLF